MGRSKKTASIVEIVEEVPTVETTEVSAPRILEDVSEEQQKRDDLEIDMQIALPKSVVDRRFKIAYKEAAKARGDKTKAAKRSKWDWLAQQMAELTLTDKAKLKVSEFEALMAANGIDCNRWPNRSAGWEGRLRMTACLVLRKQMAEAADGVLKLADGTERQMPQEDLDALVAKYV